MSSRGVGGGGGGQFFLCTQGALDLFSNAQRGL